MVGVKMVNREGGRCGEHEKMRQKKEREVYEGVVWLHDEAGNTAEGGVWWGTMAQHTAH